MFTLRLYRIYLDIVEKEGKKKGMFEGVALFPSNNYHYSHLQQKHKVKIVQNYESEDNCICQECIPCRK